MTAPVTMTNHPTDETLAAFIDGRLDTEARRKVIEHVAICADCRDVVNAAPAVSLALNDDHALRLANRRQSPWKSVAIGGLSAAAVMALAIYLTPILKTFSNRSDGIPALVRASDALAYRSVEGRLSGGFGYRPMRRVMRDAGRDITQDPERWPILEAASAVQKAAAHSRSRSNTHAVGLAQLLLGNRREAVSSLEQVIREGSDEEQVVVAIRKSRDAIALSDLSAAYLALADSERNNETLQLALEAAEQAWELKKTPETAWNRALALDALGLRRAAAGAWNEYLKLDPNSEWSTEARRRSKETSSETDTELWEAVKPLLESPALPTQENVNAWASRFPSRLASYAQTEILGRWGKAITDGEKRLAVDSLQLAKSVEIGLRAASTDLLIRDTIDAIDRAGSAETVALARGHARFAYAVHLYEEQSIERAAELFRLAEFDLSTGNSPSVTACRLYVAFCQYYKNDYAVAMRILDDALNHLGQERRYHQVIGQIQWMRGMCLKIDGQLDASGAAYQDALAHFLASKDLEGQAAIHNLVAELEEFVGRRAEAWSHRSRAVELAAASGSFRRLHPVLNEMADGMLAGGCIRAALAVQGEVLANAQRANNPFYIADSYLWRALVLSNLGENALALRDLEQARRSLRDVPDEAVRRKLSADADWFEARFRRESSPSRALKLVDAALAFAAEIDNHVRLSALHLERGALVLEQHGFNAAERDFMRGLDEMELHRSSLSSSDDRGAYFARAEELIELYVSAALREGHVDRAFSAVERVRQRTMLEAIDVEPSPPAVTNGKSTVASLARVQRALPSATYLAYYFAASDQLCVFIVSSKEVNVVRKHVTRRELADLTHEYIRTLISEAPSDRVKVTAHALYRAVGEPALQFVPPHADLVIVKPQVLAEVSWAGLWTGEDYLIERNPISVVPSGSYYVAALESRTSTLGAASVLVVNPETSVDSEVPRLAGGEAEAARVAGVYRNLTRITGDQATKGQLVSMWTRYTLVHIATHTALIEGREGATGLLLSGPVPSSILSAREIASQRTDETSVVVLAACRSSGADSAPANAAATLSGAFLRSGVDTVISALYDVPDAEAVDVIVAFHRNFSQGITAARALQRAQVDAQRSGSSTMAWATYELNGLGLTVI